MIRYYTREAGVRNLEREIAKICRKVVKQLLLKAKKPKKQEARRHAEERSTSISACAASATAGRGEQPRSARSPASPGPRSAASC
jgi:ATP-dependent Lon protease